MKGGCFLPTDTFDRLIFYSRVQNYTVYLWLFLITMRQALKTHRTSKIASHYRNQQVQKKQVVLKISHRSNTTMVNYYHQNVKLLQYFFWPQQCCSGRTQQVIVKGNGYSPEQFHVLKTKMKIIDGLSLPCK